MPAAIAGPMQFAGIHYMEPAIGGKKKPKPLAGNVIFANESVRVVTRRGALTVSQMRYDQIKTATYSRSKHPRWKFGLGLAVAAGATLAVPAGATGLPVVFAKAKHHWLTLQGEDDYVVLRLSKKNHQYVLTAVEVALGDVDLERLAD